MEAALSHRAARGLLRGLLLALVLAQGGCDWVFGPEERVPSTLTVVSGASQLGRVGDPLPQPFVVEVLDQDNDPLPDQPVAWSSDALPPVDTTRTDSLGRARLTLTLGQTPGVYTARATVDEVGEVLFAATALAGDPAELEASEDSVRFVALGDTVSLDVEVRDRFGNVLEVPASWSSSDPSVVSVDSAGRVASRGTGTAEVTASAGEASVTIGAEVDQLVTAIALAPHRDTLRTAGQQVALSAVATDANGFEVASPGLAWRSLGPDVVSVDGAGRATARGRGTARIEASADGAADTVALTMVPWGRVTVSMELNRWEIYDVVFPIMERHGLTGNIEVVLMYLGEPDRITMPQMREMHGAGWAVVPHTRTLPNLTELSDAALRDEVLGSKQWVLDQGFRGAETFIVPGHNAGAREMELIRAHFTAARSRGFLHVRQMVNWPPADPYRIVGLEGEDFLDSAAGRAELRDLWREAIHQGRLLEIYFHRVKESQAGGFEAFIKELSGYRQYVATFSELFEN